MIPYEAVRLGAGLDKNNQLDAQAQRRAIACLKRFGERLRGLPPQAVRAVATNTFRVASNAAELLEESQAALGFPIEIIAGQEEARMIFIGVSHGLPATMNKRLVIDIGGGSTEFIIGQGFEPESMESLLWVVSATVCGFFRMARFRKTACGMPKLQPERKFNVFSSSFRRNTGRKPWARPAQRVHWAKFCE